MKQIPYCKSYITQQDKQYVNQALTLPLLSGDGFFTKKCHTLLQEKTKTQKALLTHSCTAALEMSALLLNLAPGDEVILPSFTFVSTANAFVLRGAVPVFIDIRPDTLNMDETLIESAITSKTKAIVPVHYAGVACEMDFINMIARHFNLAVVEDAAQGVEAYYKDKPLGTLGNLGCYSFHGTKNIISGEGGALLIQDSRFIDSAEIYREKGTDRSQFLKGQVDKYTWQTVGSSYLPSELTAALLLGQLENVEEITKMRLALWQRYHEQLLPLCQKYGFQCPTIPTNAKHNGHIYYLIMNHEETADKLFAFLKQFGIQALSHYKPLHRAPAGLTYGRVSSKMDCTNDLPYRLVRLPLWVGMTDDDIDYIVNHIEKFFKG
ncbi:MAG: dTDP-4-amino-4,6-dideoxygalactose transaminase [Holosporales bacterium]